LKSAVSLSERRNARDRDTVVIPFSARVRERPSAERVHFLRPVPATTSNSKLNINTPGYI